VRVVPVEALREFVNPSLGQWSGLQSVVMVERRRKSRVRGRGSASTTRALYLTSLPAHQPEHPTRIGQAIRAHWQIENGQHWVLDVVWHEDASRVRRDQAPRNLALLKRLATNIMRQDNTYDISLSLKRKIAAWNTDFLLHKLLSAKPQPTSSKAIALAVERSGARVPPAIARGPSLVEPGALGTAPRNQPTLVDRGRARETLVAPQEPDPGRDQLHQPEQLVPGSANAPAQLLQPEEAHCI